MTDELPSDFDWVEARKKCSAVKVFELLSLQAKKNVESAQVVEDGRIISAVEYVSHPGGFSVVSNRGWSDFTGVRLALLGDEISIETFPNAKTVTATLTLNDRGECRLLLDGQELDRWQLLKRFLEPLLFRARMGGR